MLVEMVRKTFFQSYCKTGERWGSTRNVAKTAGDSQQTNRVRWSVVRKLLRGDIQGGRLPLNKQATAFLLKAALGDQILRMIASQGGRGPRSFLDWLQILAKVGLADKRQHRDPGPDPEQNGTQRNLSLLLNPRPPRSQLVTSLTPTAS